MTVLDTHTWVWWESNPELLSTDAKRAADQAAAQRNLYVSSISVWEVALLVTRGRLKLTMDLTDWIRHSEALPFIQFVPVNNAIATQSVLLSKPLHQDPADRIIIATSLALNADLVTKDEKIRAYPHVSTVW